MDAGLDVDGGVAAAALQSMEGKPTAPLQVVVQMKQARKRCTGRLGYSRWISAGRPWGVAGGSGVWEAGRKKGSQTWVVIPG